MRRIAVTLLSLAIGLLASCQPAFAAPVPSYPLVPPPYDSTAAAIGSMDGLVINFPVWAFGQTLIYGTPTVGQCAKWITGPNGLQLTSVACAGGGGTVTSVALGLSAFNCTGSPITTSGTISCVLANENPNSFLAGPASGSAGPATFRGITVADLFGGAGATSSTYLRGDGTWAAVSGASGGTVTSITAGTGLSGGTITTSGTISLPASGVTAGTYSNATVTFDAEGRATFAENGTEEVPYAGAVCSSSVPVTSTFGTTYNLGSLSLGNSASGIVVSGAPTGLNDSLSLALEAAPSAPYTIYMRAASIQGSAGTATYGGVGIALYNSSSGKSITIVPSNNQGIDISAWTSTESRDSNLFRYFFINQINWVEIYVTSTQVTFYVSSDGYVWYQYYGPYSFSSWPGATPDYVGIAIDNNYQGGSAVIQCFGSSAPS